MTASHCLSSMNPRDFVIVQKPRVDRREAMPTGLSPTKLIYKVIVPGSASGSERSRDVALMLFANSVSTDVIALAKKTPPIGAKVTVVGYGMTTTNRENDSDPLLQRRSGSNFIANNDSGVIRFRGPVNDNGLNIDSGQSGGAPGDSGGPLLSDGRVVGIVSGGHNGNATTIENYYADVNNDYVKALIKDAVQAGARLYDPDKKAEAEESETPLSDKKDLTDEKSSMEDSESEPKQNSDC